MNHELHQKTIVCPYCWESFSIYIEPNLEVGENYVEDCYICCRPIEITIEHQNNENIDIRIAPISGNAF